MFREGIPQARGGGTKALSQLCESWSLEEGAGECLWNEENVLRSVG